MGVSVTLLRGALIVLVDRVFVPILGLQRIDNVLPGQVIQVAPAQIFAKLLVLSFGV